jgi:hypothetical protein
MTAVAKAGDEDLVRQYLSPVCSGKAVNWAARPRDLTRWFVVTATTSAACEGRPVDGTVCGI